MENQNTIQFSAHAADKIQIATAISRFSTNWKTKTLKWGSLVQQLKQVTRTQETVEEYRRMSTKDKGKVKDVGGFVGGALTGTRRLGSAVASRSLITLDLDSIKGKTAEEVWEQYKDWIHAEAVLYSTHSHTGKNPRLRLIILTNRPMTPEEYEPCARKVAELSEIGLDAFDDTTYEAYRLMYWPSCPRDGEFVYEHFIGDPLDVDQILAEYDDWRDVETWPISSRQTQIIERAKKRQEDPLEKPGLIGAFCRTYTIEEAIDTYLSDIYLPSTSPDRYTYKDGSTYGGLVLYEDKFAYSHHATDPAGGKLCNAFDLVRIHKFGELDHDAPQGTKGNRLPSYQHMMALVQGDKDVAKRLTEEKIQEVEEDFTFEEAADDDWMGQVAFNKKGEIENTISNLVLVMNNDPNLKGKLRYDEFQNRASVEPGVPWGPETGRHDWQDLDDSGLHDYLEKVYSLGTMAKVEDAKNLAFNQNKFHPVKQYLEGLPVWDGTPRIATVFCDYLGAEDNLYTREVAKVHFTAAIKRIYEPGCKYDTMVILAGRQGLGKSTFIATLAGDWFTDSLYTIKGKEAAELIQGVWHVELGEMSAMKKSDRDAVKAFLSKKDDIYRVAYAKNTARFPRQCVFWGTSNEYNFLRDPTGDRRSFPIDCGLQEPKKDVFHELAGERDQIWAEAKELYQEGHDTYLTGEALELSIKAQEEHKEDTPWYGLIQNYLDAEYPANWNDLELYERQSWIQGDIDLTSGTYSDERMYLDRVCALQIWCELLGGRKQNLNTSVTLRINDILTAMPGWERSKSPMRFTIYGLQRAFRRKDVIGMQLKE